MGTKQKLIFESLKFIQPRVDNKLLILKTLKLHLVEWILQIIWSCKLKIKILKEKFSQNTIKSLGVSKNKLQPSSDNIMN